MKKIILGVVAVVVLAAAGYWYWEKASKPATSFRTAQVERGVLMATISSTGTIEPEDVVDIGAQVNGPIKKFGTDPRGDTNSKYKNKLIDYGSPVDKDTVLAEIDPAIYEAQRDQAKATLDQNIAMVISARAQVEADQANILAAKANLTQMKSKLWQADRDYQRAVSMLPKGGIAQSDYDGYKATFDQGGANVQSAEAAIKQAEAQLALDNAKITTALAAQKTAEAALKNAQTNLDYCTIKAPVKGVVVDRRVNVGQTVVSSLSASSLFLLAKDLNRLQVWASVNEADIGNVRPGQKVTFTVDAYPGKIFEGTVHEDQPRLNASMTQNVVTYTVVVDTDNSGKFKLTRAGRGALRSAGIPKEDMDKLKELTDKEFDSKEKFLAALGNVLDKDALDHFRDAILYQAETGKLLPYLTANLTFEVKRVEKALKVTNTALRWKPRPDLVIPSARQEYMASQRKNKPQDGAPAPAGADKEPHDRGILWVQDGSFVRPVKVKIGLSDGLYTEITEGDINEDDTVVVGENRGGADSGTSNPFAPNMFKSNK
jgi:HlyD family secretion protein